MENKIRHLELIQGVVNRLSSNSFMLKGWAVTLVAGIFVLAGKDTEKLYFLVAYVPVIIFLVAGCILFAARSFVSCII